MAAQVPAALKSADITRFAVRATQLEKAKPVVAYWCEYWIVNQILTKGLHNADQESLTYTTTMMDKLEQFKGENSSNDAVVDDMAGKAYVEQFGLETFLRADNAVRANKASRQTADTFQASATFLDLLQIWGPIEPEITAKIKYAKYHALRIAKALKAGEDPNLSNPAPESLPEEQLPALDPNDADVQALNGGNLKSRQASVVEIPDEAHSLQRSLAARSSLDESLHPSRDSSIPRPPNSKARQPSVVEVKDEADKVQSNLARQSTLDESLHPSRAPSVPPPENHDVSPQTGPDPSSFYGNDGNDLVSPMEPADERKPSIGGNYFPQVPGFVKDVQESNLPSAPPDPTSPFDFPSAPSEPSLPRVPTSFNQPTVHSNPPNQSGHFVPPGQPIPPNLAPQPAPRQPIPQAPPQLHQAQQPQAMPPFQPAPPSNIPSYPTHHTYAAPIPNPAPPPPIPAPNVVLDEEAIMKAQKHARWAISALNFEDVPTAIRELRGALETLGAR